VNSWLLFWAEAVELSVGLYSSGLMDRDSSDTTEPSPRMMEGMLLSISRGTSIESKKEELSSSSSSRTS